MMNSIKPNHHLVLYFQVHQPSRLRPFQFFDIGAGPPYFDDKLNEEILGRITANCYLPTNRLLLNLIKKYPQIKITFSISGSTIDQFEEFSPEVLLSFRDLAQTGNVEFLGETYYHSLACMISPNEFSSQVLRHAEKIEEHFGVRPTFFRNTELIYNNDLGQKISAMGFAGAITDGIESILNNRSPHNVFSHPANADFKILVRNYRLSDDIAFRYSPQDLPAERYLDWLSRVPADQPIVTLAMDYETFGEHKKSNTDIHRFLEKMLAGIATSSDYKMTTPSEAVKTIEPHSLLFVPQYVSWADRERDLSAWLGNDMQRDAFDAVKRLEKKLKILNDEELLCIWRHFQTSDHFYYMSTKNESDGSVHSYFSPYVSPYEAFINYMNAISDFSLQVKKRFAKERRPQVKRKTIPEGNSVQL